MIVKILARIVDALVVVVSVFYICWDTVHFNVLQLLAWCLILAGYLTAMIMKARRVRRGRNNGEDHS